MQHSASSRCANIALVDAVANARGGVPPAVEPEATLYGVSET